MRFGRGRKYWPSLLIGALVLTSAQVEFSNAAYTSSAMRPGDSWSSDILAAPAPLSCAWTGTNSLSLTWTDTTTWAAGYDYERSNSSGVGFSALGSTVGHASTSANDTNPAPPTLRYYRVRSKYGTTWTSPYASEVVSNTCSGTMTTLSIPAMTENSGVAVDASGNVYSADKLGHKIYKTTTGGVTTVFAGTGSAGYSGDGGAATSATLNQPRGMAFDSSGNLYIADTSNNVIRKVTSGGVISTFAGTGVAGYSGDGAAATAAKLSGPFSVGVDSSSNVLIADTGNNVIRKVAVGGTITTIAGTGVAGYSGDGGAATLAKLDTPFSAIADSSGNVYIADTDNNVIRKISGTTITTVAGGGANTACTYSGSATGVSLLQPKRLGYDAVGNRIFIPDADRDCVRVLSGSTVSQVAGTGTGGYSGDNGPAVGALVDAPVALAYSAAGDLYIADSLNGVTRKVLDV